jgi:AcrR family transcriptional regulator
MANASEPYPVTSEARMRIIDAGIRCVVREGVQGASMSAIAAEAGVSKALLHYHFTDRAQLLAEVVTTIGKKLVTREHGALEQGEAAAAVDLLWRRVEAELQRGELHALLELRTVRDASVRHAMEQTGTARRAAAATTVGRLFARFGLTPRVPVELIGDTTITFIDGLALDYEPGRDLRVSFDVFWLAILSLGD